MNIWKRLPFYLKVIIVSHVAAIFLVLLLVLSMCGGIDEADRQIEQSNVSAAYFDIEVNGETKPLAAWNESGEGISAEKVTLIARQAVQLDGIMFETDKLSVSTNAVVSGNGVADQWLLVVGQESHRHTFDAPPVLAAGERVTVDLSNRISIVCIFVGCKEAEITN